MQTVRDVVIELLAERKGELDGTTNGLENAAGGIRTLRHVRTSAH